MSFGSRLREARTALGLTQEALGNALGMVPQTISKWERDECMPDAALLPALADILQISLDRLFEREKGNCEDAEAAMERWLRPLGAGERRRATESLLGFLFHFLNGRGDEDGGSYPFDGPDFPRENSLFSLLLDRGMLLYSTGRQLPLFCYLGETGEGWGALPEETETQAALWEALGDRETRRAIRRSFTENEIPYEMAALIADYGLRSPEETLERLARIRVLHRLSTAVDGKETELFRLSPSPQLLALLLIGRALFPAQPWQGLSAATTAGRMGKPLLGRGEGTDLPPEAADKLSRSGFVNTAPPEGCGGY